MIKALAKQIIDLDAVETYGRVMAVRELMVEVAGPIHAMWVGVHVLIKTGIGPGVPCEVVGFASGRAGHAVRFAQRGAARLPGGGTDYRRQRAAFGSLARSGGQRFRRANRRLAAAAGRARTLFVPVLAAASAPPPARGRAARARVRVLNTFLTTCRGQRMGIFSGSGSGVGKSVLLSMLARNVATDVSVIGLVGERGHEVQEFLQDDLGPAGLAGSVVVSTSDEPALIRRQAAYLTLAIAEFFRDLSKDLLVLMDSVTRFAMAQREIRLSASEPPTANGYTPTVFTELPWLLERAGPGTDAGTITGIFTVLVDGDDQNEPVADAVRGILDGHIVMERAIAERGRYPAINVLKSISGTMPRAANRAYLPVLNLAKQVMATYSDWRS